MRERGPWGGSEVQGTGMKSLGLESPESTIRGVGARVYKASLQGHKGAKAQGTCELDQKLLHLCHDCQRSAHRRHFQVHANLSFYRHDQIRRAPSRGYASDVHTNAPDSFPDDAAILILLTTSDNVRSSLPRIPRCCYGPTNAPFTQHHTHYSSFGCTMEPTF